MTSQCLSEFNPEAATVRQKFQDLLGHPMTRIFMSRYVDRTVVNTYIVQKERGSRVLAQIGHELWSPIMPSLDPTVRVDRAGIILGARWTLEDPSHVCDFLTPDPESLATFNGLLEHIQQVTKVEESRQGIV